MQWRDNDHSDTATTNEQVRAAAVLAPGSSISGLHKLRGREFELLLLLFGLLCGQTQTTTNTIKSSDLRRPSLLWGRRSDRHLRAVCMRERSRESR